MTEIKELLKEIKQRQAEGKPCLEVRINGKSCYMPFEGMVTKPSIKDEKYNDYMVKRYIYDKLIEYYNKK